jgi:hypothetical protein
MDMFLARLIEEQGEETVLWLAKSDRLMRSKVNIQVMANLIDRSVDHNIDRSVDEIQGE